MTGVGERDSENIKLLLAVGVEEPLRKVTSSKLGDLRVGVADGNEELEVKDPTGVCW